MVFLMKMIFAIELLKHTNNQYGIVQLQNLRIRVGIAAADFRRALNQTSEAVADVARLQVVAPRIPCCS